MTSWTNEAGITLVPPLPDINQLLIDAITCHNSGQSVAAERLYQTILSAVPDNALANYYYALVLSKQDGSQDANNLVQADLLLEKAVRLDPKLAPAYLQLGILYSQRGESTKAISAYKEAIKANPQSEEAHYRLAQAYSRAGDKLEAQAELQIYREQAKKTAEQADHDRREVQQFVYTLREQTPGTEPRLKCY